MTPRIRVILVFATLLAALGPFSAIHAQSVPVADTATLAAIAEWRADALRRVDPAYHDVVAAMYTDQPVSVEAGTLNAAMQAKAQAEQAAIADLDKSSRALIETYYAAVEAAEFGGLPPTTNEG
jgi:hypothetical protein